MRKFAIGLMSGTSFDGLSMVLGSFLEEKKSFKVLFHKTVPYPKSILQCLNRGESLTLPEISRLHFQLGLFYADSLEAFIKKNKISMERIAAIGSHGQTLFHEPKGIIPNTFQIGEVSALAQRFGVPVVNDFRSRSIAANEEGAPLVPFFDDAFFGGGPARAFQNIGGIGNVTVVGKGIKVIAFDTGPGNCLMDWAMKNITRGKQLFDKNGAYASKGKVWVECVQQMLKHSYFKRPPPKSTGRELFRKEFIPSRYRKKIRSSPMDFLATLTYFTAATIAENYRRFVFPKVSLKEVVVSGGGVYNRTLMGYLKELLKPISVCSIEDFGIPAQAKEPLAFAFFALRAVEGKINSVSLGKKNKKGLILGKITPA